MTCCALVHGETVARGIFGSGRLRSMSPWPVRVKGDELNAMAGVLKGGCRLHQQGPRWDRSAERVLACQCFGAGFCYGLVLFARAAADAYRADDFAVSGEGMPPAKIMILPAGPLSGVDVCPLGVQDVRGCAGIVFDFGLGCHARARPSRVRTA